MVVGFDRNINYYKIQYATLCIRENPGCMFIATNRDAVTHLTDAQEWAGGAERGGRVRDAPRLVVVVVVGVGGAMDASQCSRDAQRARLRALLAALSQPMCSVAHASHGANRHRASLRPIRACLCMPRRQRLDGGRDCGLHEA